MKIGSFLSEMFTLPGSLKEACDTFGSVIYNNYLSGNKTVWISRAENANEFTFQDIADHDRKLSTALNTSPTFLPESKPILIVKF